MAGGVSPTTSLVLALFVLLALELHGRTQAATVVVPLDRAEGWIEWGYRGRPNHAITRSPSGLAVNVRGSAGGLAYRLPAPAVVRRIRATGRIDGSLAVDPARQGLEGHDDFALRVGLVVRGDKRLGFLERRLVPAWVRHLHDLAPRGTGISHVHFFNVGAPGSAVGRERTHPLNELLRETIATVLQADGGFDLEVTPPAAAETLAIWLSMDGDDTRSTFTVRLTSLAFEPAR